MLNYINSGPGIRRNFYLSGAGMNETATLSVRINSPHIRAGRPEGKQLALWLTGRANAILALCDHQESMANIYFQAFENLKTAYAGPGLSLTASDPIPPLSMEAIQFDIALVHEAHAPATLSRSPGVPVPPVGYSHLPDPDEARTIYQQKKAELSGPESSQSGRKLID